jgi:hypothetical protein
MANISISVSKEELFTIRSALRVLVSDLTTTYDDQPTKERLKEISDVENLLKRLGGANGTSTPNKA